MVKKLLKDAKEDMEKIVEIFENSGSQNESLHLLTGSQFLGMSEEERGEILQDPIIIRTPSL